MPVPTWAISMRVPSNRSPIRSERVSYTIHCPSGDHTLQFVSMRPPGPNVICCSIIQFIDRINKIFRIDRISWILRLTGLLLAVPVVGAMLRHEQKSVHPKPVHPALVVAQNNYTCTNWKLVGVSTFEAEYTRIRDGGGLLVCASQEPMQTQESVLLRAAAGGFQEIFPTKITKWHNI